MKSTNTSKLPKHIYQIEEAGIGVRKPVRYTRTEGPEFEALMKYARDTIDADWIAVNPSRIALRDLLVYFGDQK